MDVVDTFRVVRRRIWIVLPVLLLTLVLAALAMFSIPPEYTARSSLLVYGFDSTPSPVSPALLAASLQDGETVDELKGEGATAQYTVASDSSGFLTVTARSLEPS